MKQIIPFTKDITFKTKVSEITSISLDNDLILKGEDIITGNFYITGTYKMLKTSSIEEKYSYKIPCDIAISSNYDAYLATIDIDNFTYELINDDTIQINIDLLIDNLELKEEVKEDREDEAEEIIADQKSIKEENIKAKKIIEIQNNQKINKKTTRTISDVDEQIISKAEITKDLNMNKDEISSIFKDSNNNESYKTYCIYLVRESDTIEKIAKSYKVEISDIENYNDITNITKGMKLVIPSSND